MSGAVTKNKGKDVGNDVEVVDIDGGRSNDDNNKRSPERSIHSAGGPGNEAGSFTSQTTAQMAGSELGVGGNGSASIKASSGCSYSVVTEVEPAYDEGGGRNYPGSNISSNRKKRL